MKTPNHNGQQKMKGIILAIILLMISGAIHLIAITFVPFFAGGFRFELPVRAVIPLILSSLIFAGILFAGINFATAAERYFECFCVLLIVEAFFTAFWTTIGRDMLG